MSEEQMLQAVIDSVANNTEFIGGICMGAFMAFLYLLIVGLFGGLIDLLFVWLRRKIKGKKKKEQD